MAKLICSNCGAELSTKEQKCPYCGSNNEFYVEPKKEVVPPPPPPQQVVEQAKPTKRFNAGVFILLLIVFWPGAIIYLIVSAAAK